MADIKYIVSVDAKGAQKEVKDFDKALEDVGKQSDKTESAHKGLWKQVAIGAIAYQAVAKAAAFAKDFVLDSAKAAIEAEQAERGLAAALEITGRPVEELTRHFIDNADALQKVTIYDDEAIKRSQTLLVQLTNLDKDGLDRATKGAIGLASVMGMDLESAAQLVAKAMSGNVSALSRYGIQVDQTKDKEGQRAEVMAKLEQFYGRATAISETYGGKLAMLKNKYGDVQEAVGKYITSNHALMDSLNAVAEAVLFQLQLNDKLADQKRTVEEMENKWSDSLARAAVAANWQYGAMGKLITAYNGNTVALAKAISQGKHGIEIQEALNNVRDEELNIFKKQQAALKLAERGTNRLETEVKQLTKAEDKHADLLKKMPKASTAAAMALNAELTPAVEDLGKEINDVSDDLMDFNVVTNFAMAEFMAKASEAWNRYGETAQNVIYGIDAIIMQSYRNQEIAMDNEYKKKVEAIENSLMSEQEKADALAALDEEFDAKRSALKAKQAKQDKAMSMIQATINTFEAASKAYTLGPIIGPILAGVITALGLGLVAKIKAQPIPLAKGGIFDRPTLMGGGAYEVAEAREKEVVAPLSGLRRELGLDKRQSSGPIVIQNHIYLDGREMKQFITRVIEETGRTGKLRLAPKAVRT